MTRIVLITNIPAPYREPVYEAVAGENGIDFHVIYCAQIEPNRQWSFDLGDYDKSFLGSRMINCFNTTIHFSGRVWQQLNLINPDVVITTGYGPIMLQAFFWTIIKRRAHIAFTDGTILSESHLTWIHRMIRGIIYKRSQCLIGASNKSLSLFRSYSVDEQKLFKSCLCVDNSRYQVHSFDNRPFDIMFAGQFIDRKMPLFFAEVGHYIVKKRGHCRALILGGGILEAEFRKALNAMPLEVEFKGFIQPDELPTYYASSKLFLFPTKSDPWGIVANEASASGTPVLICKNAGSSGELIKHNENGLELDLNPQTWADAASELLDNPEEWQKLSDAGPLIVQNFTSEQAAIGIIRAVRQSIGMQID